MGSTWLLVGFVGELFFINRMSQKVKVGSTDTVGSKGLWADIEIVSIGSSVHSGFFVIVPTVRLESVSGLEGELGNIYIICSECAAGLSVFVRAG